MKIKLEIYQKINNKYKKVNKLEVQGIDFLSDFVNYLERKACGEHIRIKYHYNYYPNENIDCYFDNGWKYSYINVPCKTGGHIDGYEIIKEYRS